MTAERTPEDRQLLIDSIIGSMALAGIYVDRGTVERVVEAGPTQLQRDWRPKTAVDGDADDATT